MRLPERGLYAITDPMLCGHGESLAARADAALAGGVRLLQFRGKHLPVDQAERDALVLRQVCHARGVPLLINDDVALARRIGAAGVHLGKDDNSIREARLTLGRDAIIGVSCYASLARAELAAALGADYVAFGSVFASPSKPEAVRAPLSLFRQARARFGKLPLCAIGGIDAEALPEVIAAGADYAAVISAVFAATEIGAAARRLALNFE